MNCAFKNRLLQGYVDGELDVVHSLEVESHMETCEECRTAYRFALDQRAALADPSFQYKPSTAALKRIDQAISREANPASSRRKPFGYAVAAVLAVLLPFLWLQLNPADPLPAAIVDAHIRSLQANHLEDVISTDQHTVKPWFNGKLDYSPPVTDLAQQGFPLIGGRLDYLSNRPVAALVYHRAKHIINVFVWPTDKGNTDLTQIKARNGYNVYHWQSKQMTWWATSDLNPGELRIFCELLRGDG
jgi:anti-sigma factor RsiW